jgi:hypothetical protein
MTKVVSHRRRSASSHSAHYLTKYHLPRLISLNRPLTTQQHSSMSGMMPYKPAPKNSTSTAANRIRERYLHQLGLQRGATGDVGADPLSSSQHHRAMLAQQNHVVVISGLPSLPEDRPSNPVTVMESHDYSTSRHTYHSITTLGSNEILISDEFSYDDDGTTTAAADRTDDSTMDTSSGTTHHLPPQKTSLKNQQHCQQQQQCNESLLHKALAYPPGFHQPPSTTNKSCTTTMPNPLSHPPALGASFPSWQGSSSSRGGKMEF